MQVLLPGTSQGRSDGTQLAGTPHPPHHIPGPTPAEKFGGTREDLPDLRAGSRHRGLPSLRRQEEFQHLARLVPAQEMGELGGSIPAALREGEVPAGRLRKVYLKPPLFRFFLSQRSLQTSSGEVFLNLKNPLLLQMAPEPGGSMPRGR